MNSYSTLGYFIEASNVVLLWNKMKIMINTI